MNLLGGSVLDGHPSARSCREGLWSSQLSAGWVGSVVLAGSAVGSVNVPLSVVILGSFFTFVRVGHEEEIFINTVKQKQHMPL